MQLIYGQDFRVSLVKASKEKDGIVNAITSANKDYEVVDDQIISVVHGNNNFVIAPIISTAEKNGGCYLQTIKNNNELGAQYLIEKNEDVQRCDAIIAIFGCRLEKNNGIGVIAGMRLGTNNYYSQDTYFDLTDDFKLEENLLLSKKIGSLDSVAKAKKKLGCIK
jgi:hypothetical protein